MKHNYLDNYELVNGYALIDTDFSIITANEKMYKFLGAVRKAAISDAIHQVDIDDFINVSNNLRIGQSKSMVLRMKRVDNSYRWVLMDIKRLYMSNNHKKEYLELNISDVIGLKNHTNHLNEDIGIYRRVLSINDKLVYTYEYDKDLFTIYNYVNDDAIAVISSTIDDVYERILKKGLIPAESIKEYTAYFNNIKNAKSVYQHHFSINVNYGDGLKPTGSYINGSTIYSQRKPIVQLEHLSFQMPIMYSQRLHMIMKTVIKCLGVMDLRNTRLTIFLIIKIIDLHLSRFILIILLNTRIPMAKRLIIQFLT